MKKRFGLPLFVLCAAVMLTASSVPVMTAGAAETGIEFSSPSVILVEAGTGTVLFEKNAEEHRPIASMVKIMTLLLTFENVDAGELDINEELTVSERAASMGGSQAFLDAGASYNTGELIKSVVVASANDSCVVLAERISGSVEGFVEDMNARASELGMEDTNFVNCTGLPAPNQYSCARDASVMFSELITHDEFFGYAGEWMFDLCHPSGRETVLTNTNRMIRTYEGCDGGKTGFTNEAMYCLSATARRGDMRLIGVITGAQSSKVRNAEMSELFDYGFAGWDVRQVIFKGVPADAVYEAPGSKEGRSRVAPSGDGFLLGRRGEENETETKCEFYEGLPLPLSAGSAVGKMTVTSGGKVVAESELVTLDELTEKGWFDIVRDISQGM